MNTKAIEMTAVSLLKLALLKTNHIIPEILENDRSPSWDGELLVYSDSSEKKENLIGKISVQVKGKYMAALNGKTASYLMERTDLVNYKNNGGVLLFVVFLNENEHLICCNDLVPEKLKYYLGRRQKKSSKKISIPLTQMPKETDTITDFIINAIEHCRRQTSFASLPIQTISEFGTLSSFTNYEFSFFGLQKHNPISFLLNSNDLYIYGRTSDSPIPIPLEYQEAVHSEVFEKVDACISVNKKMYYSSFTRVYTKEKVSCKIGDSFTLFQVIGHDEIQLNVSLCDEVHKRAHDLSFIINSFKTGCFEFNKTTFPLEKVSSDKLPSLITQWEEDYKWCLQTVQALDKLHCTKELFLSKLSDIDIRNLNCLIDGILNNNNQLKLNENIPDISFIRIGDIRILLHKTKDPSTGFFRIEDFYTTEIQIAVSADQIDYRITSQFDLCDKDTLLASDNLYLPALLPDYKKFGYRDNIIVSGANNTMLNLIGAYDATENSSFLCTATSFSEWIDKAPDEFLSSEIKTINRLQIAKRKRVLSEDEVKELYSIVDNPDASLQYKVAAYALLDNRVAAEHYLSLLSDEQKAQIINHPIEKFIK